jgi:hypothetical protein
MADLSVPIDPTMAAATLAGGSDGPAMPVTPMVPNLNPGAQSDSANMAAPIMPPASTPDYTSVAAPLAGGARPGSFANKLGLAVQKPENAIPMQADGQPVPGGWAKSLLAGAMGVLSGLGDAPVSPHGGALAGAISAQKNINAQNLQAQEQAKKDAQLAYQNRTEQQRNDELHQHNLADLYHSQVELDRDKYALLEKTTAAGSTMATDLRAANIPEIASGVSATEGKAEWVPGGKYDPSKYLPVQDGSKDEMTKQPDGSSKLEKVPTYSFFDRQNNQPVTIGEKSADYLAKFGPDPNITEDTKMSIDTYASQMTAARAAEVSEAALDKSDDEIGKSKDVKMRRSDLAATSAARTAYKIANPNASEDQVYTGISKQVGPDGKPTAVAEAASRIDQRWTPAERKDFSESRKAEDAKSLTEFDKLADDPVKMADPGTPAVIQAHLDSEGKDSPLRPKLLAMLGTAQQAGKDKILATANAAHAKDKIDDEGFIKGMGGNIMESRVSPTQANYREKKDEVLEEADKQSQDVYDRHFDAGQSEREFKLSESTPVVNTLNYLTSVKPNMDQLINQAKHLGLKQIPAVNDVVSWGKAITGNPALASYHATLLEVSDQIGKIIAGGDASSDFKLKEAQDLFHRNFNPQEIEDVGNTVNDLMDNRGKAMVENNRWLAQQYPQFLSKGWLPPNQRPLPATSNLRLSPQEEAERTERLRSEGKSSAAPAPSYPAGAILARDASGNVVGYKVGANGVYVPNPQ